MNTAQKEKLWQKAKYYFAIYETGELQNPILRDVWDRALNFVSDIRASGADDADYCEEALELAGTYSESGDTAMAIFWINQFGYRIHTEQTRKLLHNSLMDVINYRLSRRNKLVTPAYEARPSYIQFKRIIYTR